MSTEGVKHRKGYTKVSPDGDLTEDGGREMPERDPNANINPDYLRWERRRKWFERFMSKLFQKLEALAWIFAASYAIWYTNFFRNLFFNDDVNQLFLNIAMICVGVHVTLAIYASIVLPYILRVSESMETYNPRAIHIGAFTMFFGFITMVIAIWPVWGFWSFPLLFIMGMGYLMTGHFLPSNEFGSVIFGSIFVLAFVSFHFIEHEGYAHTKSL